MLIILFVTAIAISAVAAFYSIVGLTAIFAAAKLPIAVMGSFLEVGKLVAVSWLYRNWKECPKLLRIYLFSAIIVLMLITSMGIFGFLSKAHIEQTKDTGNVSMQLQLVQDKIDYEQSKIQDAKNVISQLDDAVKTLIEYDRIRGDDGSLAVRKSQQEERDELGSVIETSTQKIIELNQEKTIYTKQQIELVAELGPLKYIAELIYGDNPSQEILNKAVRWVIILIIFVFDPLAVMLLIAFNIQKNQPKQQPVGRTVRLKSFSKPSD